MKRFNGGGNESLFRLRAAVAAQVAIGLVALCGFAALAIDVGHVYNVKTELQASADAGSLAGASQFPDEIDVNQLALDYADYNHPNHGKIVQSVDIGNWSQKNDVFTSGQDPLNAVRVAVQRDHESSNAVDLFFGRVLGMKQSDVHAAAVALIGAGSCGGVWGIDGISGAGDLATDSFVSSEGAYGGSNRYANGDLCSTKDIFLDGGVEIWGDTMYGEGYDLTISGNSYMISGIMGPIPGTPEAPDFDTGDYEFDNDNLTIGLTDGGRDPWSGTQWDFFTTGVPGNDSITITGGTFYMTTILIDGQQEVHVTGPTTIYVAGPAVFTGGGIINETEDPGNLVIFADGPEVIIDGSSGFYGVVFAPTSTIELTGTGEYWGLLYGKMLDIEGTSNLHVDENQVSEYFGFNVRKPRLVD